MGALQMKQTSFGYDAHHANLLAHQIFGEGFYHPEFDQQLAENSQCQKFGRVVIGIDKKEALVYCIMMGCS
jgi:hypothetical protein